jgi:hypothetical protein
MKRLGNAIGVLGVVWLGYFWTAVTLYPHVRLAMPTVHRVVLLTLGSAVAFAFSGAAVSRYWWAGVAASLVTLTIIVARVH